MAISLFLPAKASSSLTDSRVTQLEFQVRSLQTQINQLQSRRPSSSPAGSRPPDIVSAGPTPGELSFEQQFDNLAILVIEINQRLAAIETQLGQSSSQPNNPA
ncbi:MAG: hypothetical protein AAFQ74_05420 [Cyanobacteria bacterium J06623_4]